jgi:hypothetical protein
MKNTEGYKVVVPQEYSIQSMVALVPRFAPLFSQTDWHVVHAPEKRAFVTSDEPFLLMPPKDYKPSVYGYGLMTPGTVKLVRLTERACLMMTDVSESPSIKHATGPEEWVRNVSLNITSNCERLVIGPMEALVRSLVKATGVDHTEPRLRFQMR